MDEVRVDRLIDKHGKNALLVIIREWPQKKKYKDKPELIPSLEYLVRYFFKFILLAGNDYFRNTWAVH